jgi:hypothetical protein
VLFVYIGCSLLMGDAPSPFALLLARVFANAAADLGKECVINYENPNVPLRVVPPSEYAVAPAVPALVPDVVVPDGCRPYNAPVCCFLLYVFVCICLFFVYVFIFGLGGF